MNSLLLLTAVASFGQTPAIENYTQSNLRDVSFTAKVRSGNQSELRKINRDFGESYRFDYTHFKLKEPFKLRAESKVDDTDIVFILNGGTRVVRAPRQRINLRTNVASKPGQRQTPLDFGFLTPSLVASFLDGKFVRNDRATGDLVFDLTYDKKFDDRSRYRVWIDADKKVFTKREWYGQDGNLKATFIYANPQQSNGCWIPSKVTVKNADGKTAGETEYQNIRANTGLDDSLFTP